MALDRSKDAGDHVEEAARKARSWMDRVARGGYVAKGLVYATVGILAGRAALGVGGKTTGTGGAVESTGSQPLGQTLLVLRAAGLILYGIFTFVVARYRHIETT